MATQATYDGFINLDALSGTDQEKFEFAIQAYEQDNNESIKGIAWSRPKIITRPLRVPSHMQLQSFAKYRRYGKNPNLVIDINDSQADAFSSQKRNERSSYAKGHIYKNLHIEVISPLRSVFAAGNANDQVFKNIEISAAYKAEQGILIGAGGVRSVNTTLDNVKVTEATYGVKYHNAGNQHFLNNVSLNRNRTGLYLEAYGVKVSNSFIEENTIAAVQVVNGSRIAFDTVYFEKGRFVINGLDSLLFVNCKHNGGPFEISNTQALKFESSRMFAAEMIFTDDQRPALIFENNQVSSPKVLESLKAQFGRTGAKIYGNYYN